MGRSLRMSSFCAQICEHVAVDRWKVYRPHSEAMGPYATKGTQWVGYDDEFAVRKKVSHDPPSTVPDGGPDYPNNGSCYLSRLSQHLKSSILAD